MPCLPITQGEKTVGAICGPPTMPLTKWVERIWLPTQQREMVIRHRIPGNRLHRCSRCRKRRPAKNLLVNGGGWWEPIIFCAPRKGCHDA
mgnify:CR=1 FL=1